jgi:hypothetical protein
MDALTLFGEPPAPITSADSPPAKASAEGPVWSRVKSSAKCVRCVLALVESHGQAPMSRTARFRRRAEDSDELLCHEHAQQARGSDGMAPLRAPRA